MDGGGGGVKGERDFIFLSASVNDWDLYQKLLDHLFSRHVKTSPDLHPILMSEAPVSQIQSTVLPKLRLLPVPFLTLVEQ